MVKHIKLTIFKCTVQWCLKEHSSHCCAPSLQSSYFVGCAESCALLGLSLVAASGTTLCCGARALGEWASAVACSTWTNSLRRTGLVARSMCNLPRDWTCVLCIGRQILTHCTTREGPELFSSCKTESVSMKKQQLPILPSPSAWHLPFYFLCEFDY